MPGRDRNETKERVREALDIVDIVGEYVELKPRGNRWIGLCPFHKEKTPSFTVNREDQFYHCFGCKAGGDIFSFVQEMDRVSFPEALENLAARAGISLDKMDGARKDGFDRKGALELNTRISGLFATLLQKDMGKAALDYLAKRGIDLEQIKNFKLGYSPGNYLVRAAKKASLDLPMMAQLGLVGQGQDGSYYDRFRNRLMFPIADAQNRVIGFGGRTLSNEDAKYINSPESPVFHKGKCLFGLPQAAPAFRTEKYAIVVEGYTDVIMCHQFGVHTAVAALGTALTQDHVRMLKRYVPRAILVFDADEAGRKAAMRSLPYFLEAELEVGVMFLKDGLDPCDFLLKFGQEAFLKEIHTAENLVDALLRLLELDSAKDNPQRKARLVDQALQVFTHAPRPAAREMLIQQLAGRMGLRPATLLAQISNAKTKTAPSPRPAPQRARTRTTAISDLFYKDFLALCLLKSTVPEPIRALMDQDEPGGAYGKLLKKLVLTAKTDQLFDLGNFLSTLEDSNTKCLIRLKEEEYAHVDLGKLETDCLKALERHRIKADIENARLNKDTAQEWALEMRDHELRSQ